VRLTHEHDDEHPEKQPRTPAPAQAPLASEHILALQRGAGNRAVSGMLQRKFYEMTDQGEYVWHPEEPGPEWTDLGETTWWLWPIWWYPVYEKAKAKPAEATETVAAGKKKKRRKPKAKAKPAPEGEAKAKAEAEAPPPPAVTEEPEAEAEPEAVVDDDVGFETTKSKKEKRDAAALAANVPALQAAIDGHTGAPTAILETFNRLFNASSAQGLLALGTLHSAYRAGSDGAYGFSVEVTIPGLANWVIHMHCDPDGDMASGPNPTHYKRVTDRGALGVSIALTPRQINGLIPNAAARRAEAVRRHLVPA
jgi:hypothetical protein